MHTQGRTEVSNTTKTGLAEAKAHPPPSLGRRIVPKQTPSGNRGHRDLGGGGLASWGTLGPREGIAGQLQVMSRASAWPLYHETRAMSNHSTLVARANRPPAELSALHRCGQRPL